MTSSKILVPIDGSENAARALESAIATAKSTPGTTLELLNVQPSVSSAVTMFLAKEDVSTYHRDEAMKVLGPVLEKLTAEGVTHDYHIGVGEPGQVIAAFAKHLGCTHIIMGTRGLGRALGLLLGSVATSVLKHAEAPVTLVK
jgi:nucleotide-binding universal stress UspA family protein